MLCSSVPNHSCVSRDFSFISLIMTEPHIVFQMVLASFHYISSPDYYDSKPGFSPSPGQYSPKDDSCYGGNKKAVTASVAYSNWAYGYGYTGLVEQGNCSNAGFVQGLGPEHGPSSAGPAYVTNLTKWTK